MTLKHANGAEEDVRTRPQLYVDAGGGLQPENRGCPPTTSGHHRSSATTLEQVAAADTRRNILHRIVRWAFLVPLYEYRSQQLKHAGEGKEGDEKDEARHRVWDALMKEQEVYGIVAALMFALAYSSFFGTPQELFDARVTRSMRDAYKALTAIAAGAECMGLLVSVLVIILLNLIGKDHVSEYFLDTRGKWASAMVPWGIMSGIAAMSLAALVYSATCYYIDLVSVFVPSLVAAGILSAAVFVAFAVAFAVVKYEMLLAEARKSIREAKMAKQIADANNNPADYPIYPQ